MEKGVQTVPNRDDTVSDQDGHHIGQQDKVLEPVFDFDD